MGKDLTLFKSFFLSLKAALHSSSYHAVLWFLVLGLLFGIQLEAMLLNTLVKYYDGIIKTL